MILYERISAFLYLHNASRWLLYRYYSANWQLWTDFFVWSMIIDNWKLIIEHKNICATIVSMFEFGSNLAEIMSYIAFTEAQFVLFVQIVWSFVYDSTEIWSIQNNTNWTEKKNRNKKNVYADLRANVGGVIITLCCSAVQAIKCNKITNIVESICWTNWFQLIVNRIESNQAPCWWWIIIMDGWVGSCGEKDKLLVVKWNARASERIRIHPPISSIVFKWWLFANLLNYWLMHFKRFKSPKNNKEYIKTRQRQNKECFVNDLRQLVPSIKWSLFAVFAYYFINFFSSFHFLCFCI